MRILLVEDDTPLASFICKGLKEHGFSVDHSSDGEDGLHLAITEAYDAIVVDIMLPKKDGFSLVKEVREKKSTLPILILSAKRSVEERVKGLKLGSDDYLTKPFAFVELLARINALLRRSSSIPLSNTIEAEDVLLNRLTRKVYRGEKEIFLQPKEFAILEYLMSHKAEVVSRTMLLESVWDIQFEPSTNIVDVHICHLREKINEGFEGNLIQTIRGVGYVFQSSE